ncbi:MAG: leucine rich repeat-containing protein [Rickettsiaceae bacterium]|jgi:hypothetical protein|nr:leucine rich repeat-containing protein [Rickettsiaceae bacterium]
MALNIDEIIQNIAQNNNSNLDLSCNKLSASQFKQLMQYLSNNNFITTIDLVSNNLGEEGAKALAEALKVNNTITKIDLENNYIGAEGVKAIAEALKVNDSITYINFSTNDIGDGGAKALAEALKINNSIKIIQLDDNHIGDTGGKFIADALKFNASITYVSLHWNEISDVGAKYIADALKVNKSITNFDLYCNGIGDKGAKAIAEALKVNTSITTIELTENNKFGDEGAEAIAEALKDNFCVTIISGIDSPNVEKYLERNNKMLDTAFKHAYEYICNGNNKNIIEGQASLNPISINDLYMLKHHKNFLRERLMNHVKDYDDFALKLRDYEEQNFFKLLGVGKSLEGSPLDPLPSEILVKIMGYVSDDYRITPKPKPMIWNKQEQDDANDAARGQKRLFEIEPQNNDNYNADGKQEVEEGNESPLNKKQKLDADHLNSKDEHIPEGKMEVYEEATTGYKEENPATEDTDFDALLAMYAEDAALLNPFGMDSDIYEESIMYQPD